MIVTLNRNSQSGLSKNCLGCDRFLECKDPMKSVLYACTRFKETKSSKDDGGLRIMDFLKLDFAIEQTDMSMEDSAISKGPLMVAPGEESGFNIQKIITDIVENDKVVSSDIKINDRDFLQAPNFYEFCVKDNYLKQDPFVEQAILGIRVLAEYCPDCTDMEWFDHTHKVDDTLLTFERKVALLDKGVCPHCHKKRSRMVNKGALRHYNEAAICCGQRSGKSAWIGMMAAYLTHLQIKLQKPNEVYGLLKANILHGTFCALTYAQAKDTLWEPYYGHLTDSPWFQGYHGMLNDAGQRYGEELLKLKDTFVMYRHRRILVYAAGPDKRTLRGRTRFFSSIDELGYFDNDANTAKVKMNANEVYIALERSLLTVRASAENLIRQGFDAVPTAYFLNVSSPSSVRDKIMELVRKAQGSEKIYGLIKPTWEMNPKVPKSALAEEFRKDPLAAMRDYGAQPPLTASPFIESRSEVEACIGEKKNPIRTTHKQVKAKDGTIKRYAVIDKMQTGRKPSILALDAGYSNNSFACCVAHKTGSTIKIDLLCEIQPLPGIPLHYSKIYTEIIGPIIDDRNIVLLTADRWNSLKIMSDAETEFDIATRQYSLKYADMQQFKSYMQDKQLTYPAPTMSLEEILKYDQSKYPNCFKNAPMDHALLQMLTVQDTGSQVVKGDQLTDDLFRAMMLAVCQLLDPKNAEIFDVADAAPKNKVSMANSAVFRGASGGGSSKGGSGGSAGGSTLGRIRTMS